MTKKQGSLRGKKTAAKARARSVVATQRRTAPKVALREPEIEPTLPVPSERDEAATVIRATDCRLPSVGTVVQKRDRHGIVRCECVVEAQGVRYGGNLYRSISAAALAAARDLGLRNRSQNGYVFWGLVKLRRPGSDPVEALDRAWARYLGCVEAVLAPEMAEAKRRVGRDAIARHVAELAVRGERDGATA